jgi:hypothetical protein
VFQNYESYSLTTHHARKIPGQSPNVYPLLDPTSDQQQLQLQQLRQQLALNSINKKARRQEIICEEPHLT